MTRLGYGPDKRLAIKVAARNIPTYRDPAVILIDQLPGAGSVGGRARQPRGKRSRGRRGHRRSPPRRSRARRTVVRAGRRRNRRQPRPHQRVVDRGGNRCISGPTALTARSKMFSIYRIRWRRASRGSSSRNCRRPRPPVRRAAGPAISAAYDLYLRAYAMSFTYQLRQALALLEEAIARDPHYGPRPWACGCQPLTANLNAPQ